MSDKKLRLPRLAHNWISGIGMIVAVVTAILMTFLYVIGVFAETSNPYLGIFLYMVLPPVLFFGLVLIPIGMFRAWKHFKKSGERKYPEWPYVDLNKKSHRNAVAIFIVGTILFLLVSAVGGYEAFHYTESVEFCGTTCHDVMKPEHTAYQNSPHARVACVSCHVGEGVDWYARSKLSGAYQVYSVFANAYPRPIPTPVHNLRPAQETCEQCHWPEKFFGGMQKMFNHYRYDEDNSHWPINMLIKVGGGDIRSGEATDIHWHVNQNVDVQYIARDYKRQEIPWVRVINKETGDTTVYNYDDDPATQAELDSLEIRAMDCVDCHNRPSHIYHSPDYAIDQALASGTIDQSLPEIKMVAVEALAVVYETEEEAFEKIDESIRSYYEENYPEIFNSRLDDIDKSIKAAQTEFGNNIFPEMKVRWEAYPDNIGHFNYPGCMRCHEGNHMTDEGETINHDCNSCHTIMAQGSGEMAETAPLDSMLEFRHPEDIDEAWKEVGCYECHTGVQP